MIDKNVPSIPDFFKDRDIFITGGSGFLGKVLIEKLLRSCSELHKLFILIRIKKNIQPIDRIDALKKLPIFERILTDNPNIFQKVIPIIGDISEIGLGISDSDIKQMENVSIVFHSAASVRFDDPLPQAVLMNTRGTHELILFAERLKNLKVFMHISTAYSNPTRLNIGEIIYPTHANWMDTINVAETLPSVMEQLWSKYTANSPNTYTFTKGLAEQVINDFRHRIPSVIYRPSIIISTFEEPIPGWIDNFNGPTGLLTASNTGLYLLIVFCSYYQKYT